MDCGSVRGVTGRLKYVPNTTKRCFDVNGYGFPFYRVTHYYPVEEWHGAFQWGYKLDNGIFEFFPYRLKKQAQKDYNRFVKEYNEWINDNV